MTARAQKVAGSGWTTAEVSDEDVQYSGLAATMDKLFVRVDPNEEKTKGGIILRPAGTFTREKTLKGTVLSVGPLVRDIRAGSRILFERSSGWPIPCAPGEELIGLREDMVLGELEGDE